MSPESRMIFHNMESLWAQMSNMRAGRMRNTGKENGHGMMGSRGMMGSKGMGENGMMGEGMSMMQFHNMNQQMMSYSQGMHQMMQQSGNTRMAAMYGQMIARMQQMTSELPANRDLVTSAPESPGSAYSVASLYVSNCSSCHGANGSGIKGAFPPLNGSSIVQGDKETLTKILLHGLQGQVTVKGDQYNGTMPSFGSILSDGQISDILTYVRSLPNNKSGSVSTEQVSSVRKESSSHQQLWTPDELELK
ncbi:MAG TPA: cytochrome c [Hanamia sp.]|nr:cytochrome c [Hanamia sp.]